MIISNALATGALVPQTIGDATWSGSSLVQVQAFGPDDVVTHGTSSGLQTVTATVPAQFSNVARLTGTLLLPNSGTGVKDVVVSIVQAASAATVIGGFNLHVGAITPFNGVTTFHLLNNSTTSADGTITLFPGNTPTQFTWWSDGSMQHFTIGATTIVLPITPTSVVSQVTLDLTAGVPLGQTFRFYKTQFTVFPST